jgi:predicted ATP-grasp superfamily ATP-dependent carboligase
MHAVGGVIKGGVLVAAAHQRYIRTWGIDAGEASAAVTTEPDAELEERLRSLLEGYDGIFQAQFAGEFLLDVNPRVYGSLPLAVAAGANLVRVWCDLLRGVSVPTVRARPGVRYRWIEGDLRHLWAAVRSGRLGVGRALAALRPTPGTAHSAFTFSDPRPGLLELRHRLRRR